MNKNDLVKAVEAAQSGDNKAIELIFKEFNQQIYYSVLLTVKNEELAKDITQETFITVIRKIGELENPEAFPSWIKKIAHSKCSDYYKKKEVIHEKTISTDEEDDFDVFGNIEEDDSEFIPDQALDKEDLKRIILDILNKLPDVQRAAIYMRYYEDMSVKEIAEIQGVSEGTVMSRLNYGRKAIAKAVEDYEKENDIKLHALPFLPFFHWVFEASKNQASSGVAGSIASGVSEATGVAISVSTATGGGSVATAMATGIGAKIAAIPLVAKITVPAVVAVAILTPVAIKSSKTTTTTEPTTSKTTAVQVAEIVTMQEATTEVTTEESTTEVTVFETPLIETPAVEVITIEANADTVPIQTSATQQITVATQPQTTKKEISATTKKAEKPASKETTEDEIDEDIYEIYEDGEELVEDDDEFYETEGSPEVEMDGTTSPR